MHQLVEATGPLDPQAERCAPALVQTIGVVEVPEPDRPLLVAGADEADALPLRLLEVGLGLEPPEPTGHLGGQPGGVTLLPQAGVDLHGSQVRHQRGQPGVARLRELAERDSGEPVGRQAGHDVAARALSIRG